tara:strand:- start:45 stop:650 length:606 start_codon:yes stop_codon:yes gene_type:complete
MALLFAKNNSLSAVTALPASVSGGALTLLSTQTASSSSTIDFTSGIDSTYKEYIFKFYDIHPATDGTDFSFQVETGTNTDYNQTITSTYFRARHDEDDSGTQLVYATGNDLAQSTSFQIIAGDIGNDNDQSYSGTLHLFNPSSTTFVKHFISSGNEARNDDRTANNFVAGYINDTTAITRIRFKMASGNIDSGTIKMYGVS